MDFALVWENLPRFFNGALITVELTVVSCLIGFLLAVPIALMRLSRNPVMLGASTAYVFYFRGTPLLVQIFLIYYGSGQFQATLDALGLWVLFREPYFCAILSLALNTAAYTGEILRGGIAGIPRGEIDAADALGLSRLQRFRLIVMPRAMRLAWPAYTNEVVYQLQATSLVSIITILDITGIARLVASTGFVFYETFLAAAMFYLALVYGLLFVFRRVEDRISGHLEAERASTRIPLQKAFEGGH